MRKVVTYTNNILVVVAFTGLLVFGLCVDSGPYRAAFNDGLWSSLCALPMVLVSYSIPNWYLLGVLATFIGECRKELGQSWDLPRMWTTATFTGLATVSMVMFAGSYVDISATLSPDQSLYWKIAGVIVLAGLGLGASANNPVEALMVR